MRLLFMMLGNFTSLITSMLHHAGKQQQDYTKRGIFPFNKLISAFNHNLLLLKPTHAIKRWRYPLTKKVYVWVLKMQGEI